MMVYSICDWLTVNYNADLILILMWTISLLNSIWFKRLSRGYSTNHYSVNKILKKKFSRKFICDLWFL